jgi:hypothetical protein
MFRVAHARLASDVGELGGLNKAKSAKHHTSILRKEGTKKRQVTWTSRHWLEEPRITSSGRMMKVRERENDASGTEEEHIPVKR